MSFGNRVLALVAALAVIVPLQAKAANVTYSIGTVVFGEGTNLGSGTLNGSFDFDDVSNLVTAVNFTVSGSSPSGVADGLFDSFLYSPTNTLGINGNLTAFRSSDGLTPLAAVVMSIDKTPLPLVPFLGDFTLSGIGAGPCLSGIGIGPPCSLISLTNTASSAVAESGPGDIGQVPLPAPILMLIGALSVLGGMAMRRRAAFA